MSRYHENVTWQTSDGSWSIGFYVPVYSGDVSDEWDVEWEDEFSWAATGFTTPDAAFNAWRGANPGGGNVVPFKGNEALVEHYNKLAGYYFHPEVKIEDEKVANEQKNVEHFTQLMAQFENNHRYVGAKVTVTTGDPETIHTRLGLTQTHTGVLREKDNWLVLIHDGSNLPVFDMLNNKFAGNIHNIRQITTRW